MVNLDKYSIHGAFGETQQSKAKQNKTNNQVRCYNVTFLSPLVEGHLAFGRVTLFHPKKVLANRSSFSQDVRKQPDEPWWNAGIFGGNPKVAYILRIFSVWSHKRGWFTWKIKHNSYSPNDGLMVIYHSRIRVKSGGTHFSKTYLVKSFPFRLCPQPLLKVNSIVNRNVGFPNQREDSPLSGASAASVVPRWLQAPSPACRDRDGAISMLI